MTVREEQQAKRIKELSGRNALLEERIADLEALLSEELPDFLSSDLTRTEATVASLLLRRPIVTRDAIMTFMYSTRADAPSVKIADVFICRLRRKLKPYGIEIETVWGRGYRLTKEGRQMLENYAAKGSAA